MNDWVLPYLGKPWEACKSGPNSFDCWGLIVSVYRERLGFDLDPHANVVRGNFQSVARGIKVWIEREWRELPQSVHMCGVSLSSLPNSAFHVGIFVDTDEGLILHCQKHSGVVIEPLASVRLKFKHIKYYGLRVRD